KKQIGCVCVVQDRRQYEQRTRRCDSCRFCSKTCAFLSISAVGATPAKSDNFVRLIPTRRHSCRIFIERPFPVFQRRGAKTQRPMQDLSKYLSTEFFASLRLCVERLGRTFGL